MKDWIEFRTMWTPVIIEAIFISGSILMLAGGLFEAIDGATPSERWGALAVALLGPVVLRIYCELLIVVFKIHEGIEAIFDAMPDTEPADAPTGRSIA